MSDCLRRPPLVAKKRTYSQHLGDDMEEEDDTASCPGINDGKVCGYNLTKTTKFCSECGWKVNPSIFHQRRITSAPDLDLYICDGRDDEGNICGKEVPPDKKFCSNCGKQRKKVARLDSDVSSESMAISSAVFENAGEQQMTITEQATQRTENITEMASEDCSNEVKDDASEESQSAGKSGISSLCDLPEATDNQEERVHSDRTRTSDVEEMANAGGISNQEEMVNSGGISNQEEMVNSGEISNQEEMVNSNGTSNEEDMVNSGGTSNQEEMVNTDGSSSAQDNPHHSDPPTETETSHKDRSVNERSAVQDDEADDDLESARGMQTERNLADEGSVSQPKSFKSERHLKLKSSNDSIKHLDAEQSNAARTETKLMPENTDDVIVVDRDDAEKETKDSVRKSSDVSMGNKGRRDDKASVTTNDKSLSTIKVKDSEAADNSKLSGNAPDGAINRTTIMDNGKELAVTVLPPKKLRNEENENTQPPKGRQTKSNSGTKSSAVQSKIAVHFHVVLPKEEFHFKASKGDVVAMRFDHSDLGGWSQTNHIMKEEKAIDAKNALMTYLVEMDKFLLTGGRSVEYKYVIHHGGNSTKTEYEFVPKKVAWKDKIANRELRIPRDQSNSVTEWHQYDGIMSTEPEGFIKSIFSNTFGKLTGAYHEKLIKRTKEALTAMLPSWDDIQGVERHSGKCLLEKLDQVCFCVKYSFLNENLTPDESKMQEVLREYIQIMVQRLREEVNRRHRETEVEAGVRLASACCVVYIMQKYLLEPSIEITKPLFWALLLQVDKDSLRCHDYEQLIDVHFPTDVWKEKMGDCLMNFVSRMVTKDFVEPLWLFAVPLLHFLCKYSQPKTPLKNNVHHRTQEYWGIKDLTKLVNNFKCDNVKTMPLQEYVEHLGPLFEVDRLLPRTLLAVMSLDPHIPYLYGSKAFPVDACMANCSYFARMEKDIKNLMPALEKLEELTKDCLSQFRPSNLEELDEKASQLYTERNLAMDVLDEICGKVLFLNMGHVVASVTQVTANCISNIQKLLAIAKDTDKIDETRLMLISTAAQAAFENLRSKIERWLLKAGLHDLAILKSSYGYRVYPRIDYDEIQMYGFLFGIHFFDDAATSKWKTFTEDFLMRRLKNLNPHLQILVFCDVDFKKYPAEVENCFSKSAFDVLENFENAAYSDYSYMFDIADKGESAAKLRGLLSRMFEKSWPKEMDGKQSDDEGKILRHILNWPSYKRFLSLFYGRSKKIELLSEDCVECIAKAMSIFDNVLAKLLTGGIAFLQLKLLLDEKIKGSFLELFKVIEKNSVDGMKNVPDSGVTGIDKSGVIMKVFVWRATEVQNFEELCLRLNHFLGLVRDVKSNDLMEFKGRLNWNPDKLLISDFCTPRTYASDLAQKADYRPNVTYFHLSMEGEAMLNCLWKLKNSAIFQRMWCSHLKRLIDKQTPCALAQVLETWKACMHSWTRFCEQIGNGEITFKSVDMMFGPFDKKYDLIEKELSAVVAQDVAQTRRKQIEQYHQLDQYSRGAKVMLDLREKFDLKGDFSVPEVLADMVKDKNKTLGDITDELINSGRQMEEITDKKLECLDVFLKNKKFADWLRKSVKGPKEVKVLVDLAMISAEGQGDMEVHKVTCLHAAATGYAPLIYDLTEDMGFQEFLPLCQSVWRVLDVDQMLPRKFHDTALELNWLNRVKESHGSVELNALANAQAINAKGIYSVGNLGKTRKTLDGVVELSLRLEKGDRDIETEAFVSEEVEKKKWQTLNLQQLNDLQSKLMLVAGKAQEGKKDVEGFVEILDGITRLGNLYVRICNAGCSLFHHWKAIFYCDQKRPMYARVEFGKDGKHVFCGWKKHATNGVCGYIHDLCTFMEGCLKEWLEHIEKQRTESYYLTYYTTEQLVILQNELAKINTDKTTISKNIYPLLSLVKKNCLLRNIEDAMYQAFRSLEEEEKKAEKAARAAEDKQPMDVDQNDEAQEQQKDETVQQFLEAMEELGHSRKLAKLALKECGAENIEKGILWCMENMDSVDDDDDDDNEDEDMDEGSSVDTDNLRKAPESRKEIKFSGLHLQTNLEALTANLFQAPILANKLESLQTRLKELWKMYQNEMNTSLADYLSVKHLGCMLNHLAAMDDGRIDRTLPSYLRKGKPNLILCSHAEIYAVVLSIYMNRKARKNSLPGIDEVLVCNASTTAEDVELLWRRAEGDARNHHHGKIYCLVHAELLDYDVARKSEQSLDKHSHAAQDIQLVVVCCREQEDRSHMINALDRYRVKAPSVELQDVREYLKQHLTFIGTSAVRPAADLDPERCSVRVIKSHRAGVGKSLKVHRLLEQRQDWKLPNRGYDGSFLISIPLHCKKVNPSIILERFLQYSLEPQVIVPRIFHIDIAHEVQEGVDYLLFNLLILGSITDREGYVWSRSPTDLYLIETMPLMQREAKSAEKRKQELQYVHHIFHLLPTVTCWSPTDSLNILSGTVDAVKERYTSAVVSAHDQKMDDKEFHSAMFQRPFQYLTRFTGNQELHGIQSHVPEGDYIQCIQSLLAHCGLRDPSWSELRHFVNFLNVQLRSCEQSIFCSDFLAPDLPGFLKFVVQFMMQMSKDFATRSLTISEETPEVALQLLDQNNPQANDILGHYGLKRRWETSPHPYLFFNADGNSFTFMGFIINQNTGDILEPGTGRILAPQALPRVLYDALIRNRVDLSENFDALQRWQKIEKMCRIIGIDLVHDPDNTYELTADNVKKMLAIYMRFRCDIPVIIMGETGCGKTRLIKFMCDLWKPPGAEITNMILMKVHGGTTAADIERKVKEAANHARQNREDFPDVQTVLFFDEANTTEAIGMIKEIMCDHTIGGEKLPMTYGLKLIAACNPYRKHSDAMIQRLEHAGLGYHIQANQTADKLGRIPMRQLVYRVQALPQSMLPLVWDFGQLSTEVETLYIRQMVHRYVNANPDLRGIAQLEETVSRILAASQEFMRLQKDECSFVSLRDVNRALHVMMWFYPRDKELFDKMNEKAVKNIMEAYEDREAVNDDDDDDEEEEENEEEDEKELEYRPPHDLTRSLILALGVCYHACLQKRKEYREFIAPYFVAPCDLENGAKTIEENINWCQEVFLDEVELGDNIARNQALKENLFMMVICIELRIPLFLVGKPGSSKSLAKTIVADAMQGEAARSELFRTLKSVHMVSYQCSPLSTPEGIVGTFRQCAKLQEGQDLNKFVSVVVLDEVGLAEDSDRMPLKTLHPLLEDGCEGDETPAPHKKVGFIGISNWALDPAKMNRGILVQRGVPDEQELEQSAKGICANEPIIARRIDTLVQPMAKAYLELYESALRIREFFGLRDFYSLIKMVYGFMKRSGEFPTWAELKHAVLRNFGGLDDVCPLEVFEKHLQNIDKGQPPTETDPACDSASLIRCSLSCEDADSESRYLLILTENYAALGLLQHELLKIKDAIIIFGSSFPKDQEYTQVCRNINRIKVCMETGRTVVLLNLENLYESLYDALNQYYVKFGDQRFVDLGLGTQRVKCRVHQSFRLIVVAEKQVVYEKFPIPLINRLEKHFLAMSTMLTEDQMEIVQRLCKWAEDFASIIDFRQRSSNQPKPGDVFIGYHLDTAASLVLQVCSRKRMNKEKILEEAMDLLLCCAVPEAIIRLGNTRLAASADKIYRKYFEAQSHSNLEDFLRRIIVEEQPIESLFVQVTTHSRLLLPRDAKQIAKVLGMRSEDVVLEALHAFGTEQQFCRMLKEFFVERHGSSRVLLLQCDSGDVHADLIACARYNIWNEFLQMAAEDGATDGESLMHIIFIVQLPRIAGGCFVGFQGGKWMSYHIDDLHPNNERIPPLGKLKGRSLGMLFEAAAAADVDAKDQTEEQMEEETGEEFPAEDEHMATEEDAKAEDMDFEEQNSDDAKMAGDGLEQVARLKKKQAKDGVRFTRENLESSLDIDRIVMSCLHGATAMLKDSAKEETVMKQRKTLRLQLLMKHLNEHQNSGKLSLMSIIKRRLTLLLKDKEETAMSATMANGWLSNEAASFEAICQAGTFRRSLWQYLETRVTPLLAGFIAFTDINANLDILEEDDLWIVTMWKEMLNNTDIFMLKYKDLQTATQRMELTEFEVKTTGAHGMFFRAQLPFSWLIKEQVDRLIYFAKQDASKDTRIMAENTLQTSSLGKVLEKATADVGSKAVLRRYLADFVHMVHRSQSPVPDAEYELVMADIEYAIKCQYMQEQARDMREDGDNFVVASGDMETSVPHIHLVYESIRKRLMLFSEMVQLWPESVERLAKTRVNMPLDLQCLILLLEAYLFPTKNELENVNTRKKWIDKVQLSTPIILRLLESVADVTPENVQHRDTCRCIWNRIGAVHLFIEHVCPTNSADLIHSSQWCWSLWMMLGDKTDFKTVKSFLNVDSFFKMCNKKASELFFGKLDKCPVCGETVEYPVKLPCGHVVCSQCLVELKQTNNLRCVQQGCAKAFSANLKAEEIKTQQDSKEKFARCKQQCNAFFMDVISRFCFTGNTPPEKEVIHKLMDYVTRRSRPVGNLGRGGEGDGRGNMATAQTKKTFEEILDPTPVVRSFLLQLLLQANIESVHEYLEEYFQNARAIVRTDPSQIVELCILCVQCLEDHYHKQGSQSDNDLERIHFARHLLVRSTNLLRGDILTVEIGALEAIARVRYGLTETASWMNRLYIAKDIDKALPTEVRRLCDAASRICDQDQLRWPRIYLMRQLARRFGMDVLKQLSEVQNLHWVIPTEARQNQNDAIPDRFIICGDIYRQLRELLAEVMLGKDLEPFQGALQAAQGSEEIVECVALLAIYREVTAANIHEDAKRRPTPETVQRLVEFCTANQRFRNKELALDIINNKMKGCLQVRPRQHAIERALAEVITHFKILLLNSPNNGLHKIFIDLMTAPHSVQNAFLPTMPQDDMDEIRAAVGATAAGETPTFYQCPNGHPYVIGNCGRPVAVGTCLQCGAAVGGVNYQLHQGNAAMAANVDNTRSGHILGQAQKRAPVPERQMSPAVTAVLRMLLHMSMYLGSLENPQAVSQLIIPQVQPQDVPQFLLDHVRIDVDTIHNAVGHSEDDIFVFMHILIDSVFHNIQHVAGLDLQLQNKQSRLNWENSYVNAYIAPALIGLNAKIQEANNKMVNDDRLGNNPLLRTIFEVDLPTAAADVRKIHEEPSLWRFRSQISLEHLAHALEESLTEKNKKTKQRIYPILRLFLNDEHQLRAVRLLPNILRLHRLLLQRLNRCLDSSDATTMKIGEFLEKIRDENQRQELQNLITDFAFAWDRVRPSLPNYPFGGYTIPVEYTQESVKMESRLAMLLPSLRGWGLCSVALIYYLQELQNNFLENYSKETKQSLSTRVDIYDASYAHLVAYHPIHDLQPIILANCNYSLEIGKGTTIEYDFGSMEKLLVERFIRGRPRLGIGQMEFIHYREDFTNAAIFKQLRIRIPQELLSSQADLERELRHKPTDVTDLLASLDIAVGFLVSIGGDPEMSLMRFMKETLKMKLKHIASVLVSCRLKHVESLWLLLSYLRTRIQASYGHEAFEKVEDKYREQIPDSLRQKLRLGFQHIQMDVFLILLYECIVFNITVKQNPNDEDYMDNSEFPLKDVLSYYISESGSNFSIPALEDGRFPDEVRVKHCISTWLLALDHGRRL